MHLAFYIELARTAGVVAKKTKLPVPEPAPKRDPDKRKRQKSREDDLDV